MEKPTRSGSGSSTSMPTRHIRSPRHSFTLRPSVCLALVKSLIAHSLRQTTLNATRRALIRNSLIGLERRDHWVAMGIASDRADIFPVAAGPARTMKLILLIRALDNLKQVRGHTFVFSVYKVHERAGYSLFAYRARVAPRSGACGNP